MFEESQVLGRAVNVPAPLAWIRFAGKRHVGGLCLRCTCAQVLTTSENITVTVLIPTVSGGLSAEVMPMSAYSP